MVVDTARPGGPPATTERIPPHAYFLISAVFHYLGPALAVLLFAQVSALGVAWLRVTTAAVVFAGWRRPWRVPRRTERRLVLALGVVLGVMNCTFYLAIARLPLATVGTIEFLGPVALAAAGTRTRRNAGALLLAIAGVGLLAQVRLAGEPAGFALAGANCGLFVLYVMLGHRLAADGGSVGVDRLAAAMLAAALVVTPVGLPDAFPAFGNPVLLAAGAGVGVCSSVIPYVCDQLAMARLTRSTFALLLALLPATATAIGVLVLGQAPTPAEIAGVALVVIAVAVHRDTRR